MKFSSQEHRHKCNVANQPVGVKKTEVPFTRENAPNSILDFTAVGALLLREEEGEGRGGKGRVG